MAESHGNYDLALVALSYVVAVIASLTALDLAGRVRASRGPASLAWLLGGAFSMGTGIWSMHFIGMLAYSLPIVGYDIPLTAVSMIAAILASALALSIINAGQSGRMKLALGGAIMGVGISLMHYVGMEAVQTNSPISYDWLLFSLSVLVAVLASVAALWLAFQLNPDNGNFRAPFWQRVLAAAIMGMAITGMHYIGMAATHLPVHSVNSVESANALSPLQLAGAIALISTCVMLTALLISVYDSHLVSKTSRLAESLQKANKELKAMVFQDQLTRLPNRLLFETRLTKVLSHASFELLEFAVFFVDLDRFKSVNDSLGHHIGDELIKQAGTRLQAAVREADTVARVGGDEFMVVTSKGTDRCESARIAQRIVDSLGCVFQIESALVRISSSVGISMYPDDGKSIHELMIHADAAMYSAKDVGRNNFQFFEPGMITQAEQRNRLEKRLRQAVEKSALTLAYQPKVNVISGEVTGVEALLRWHDAELGYVAPDDIISVAEETGMILPLGEWVLRMACRQSLRWHERGHPLLPVAVNLSAVQLNSRTLVDTVKGVLQETGLPPEHLELELTESAIVQHPDQALHVLLELRKLGVGLSIDDFGTGYSNLSQLKRFPINRLKIDRSFTAGMTANVQDAAIVKAVVSLAHSLGLEIIVEGVETQEQLEFIRDLNAHQYQGFLCSRALPPDDFETFLAASVSSSA